jgi:hypothetical protein
MSDETLHLTHPNAGEGPEPYTIDITGAEPDDWFVLAVTVDEETAARWGHAQQRWLDVQDEMERAFQAAKKVVEEREAAEEAEARRLDAIEAAAEKARVDAQEAELTEKHGPRQWAIVTRRQGKRHTFYGTKSRTIHHVTCGTFKRLNDDGHAAFTTEIQLVRLRTPEAIEELNPRQDPTYGEILTKPCTKCGIGLAEAAKEARLAKEDVEHERFMNQANAPDFI